MWLDWDCRQIPSFESSMSNSALICAACTLMKLGGWRAVFSASTGQHRCCCPPCGGIADCWWHVTVTNSWRHVQPCSMEHSSLSTFVPSTKKGTWRCITGLECILLRSWAITSFSSRITSCKPVPLQHVYVYRSLLFSSPFTDSSRGQTSKLSSVPGKHWWDWWRAQVLTQVSLVVLLLGTMCGDCALLHDVGLRTVHNLWLGPPPGALLPPHPEHPTALCTIPQVHGTATPGVAIPTCCKQMRSDLQPEHRPLQIGWW